ncbi:MAG TPA: hypothetical protein VG965_02670 [Patescibacteria group bacterium]|nr:hypothetical protein [Patescibacteria group bacterium]
MSHQNPRAGQMLIALIIALLIVGSSFMVGGFNKVQFKPNANPSAGNPITPPPNEAKKDLQLHTFGFQQAPQQKCALESAMANCTCDHIPYNPDIDEIQCSKTNNCELDQICSASNWEGVHTLTTLSGKQLQNTVFNLDCGWLKNLLADGRTYCVAKPVVYLYPEAPTSVDVQVDTPGKIVVSDPHYPDGGWKNVLANPDGSLLYNNKSYTELFYESEVNDFTKPDDGILIKKSELSDNLAKYIGLIGLNSAESKEFLDFWIPRLDRLNSKYILFSQIKPTAKNKIDKLNINPEPNTRIEFIAYFKPVNEQTDIKPLILPDSPPRRSGFTMVEWGGVIDN